MFETIKLIIFIMFIIIYKLKYQTSSKNQEAFNNVEYLVNDLADSQDAANTLAKIMITLNKLINYIINDYDFRNKQDRKYISYVKTIKKRLPDVKISENPTDSKFTSYSINKGEELVFCIRDKITQKIHDLNELLYVAVHEIAHIGCPELGHTELFKFINQYLLKKAVHYKLYRYIDYGIYNKKYCGMTLTTNILNDY